MRRLPEYQFNPVRDLPMGLFERYLSLWVALCITAGVILGNLFPGAFALVADLEFAHVNLMVAIFIWVMIYPMMVQIIFHRLKTWVSDPKVWY